MPGPPNDHVLDDEFSLLADNAAEADLPWAGRPAIARHDVDLADGQRLSALVWGTGSPELVLVHGGAQNAHTWDTVALALGRPLVALDLPGHGRSAWRDDHDYSPPTNAEAVAAAIEQLAPGASVVVGMSLGGLTALRVAAERPDLVPRLVVVDVTPGTDAAKAAPIVDFVTGPETFESFDELLARTIAFNPTRSESSLRRGVLHNARPRPDGTWEWRYDRLRMAPGERVDFVDMWADVDRLTMPTMLVRGGLSGVVDDADVAELRRRQPGVLVEIVDGAGHSVQGDRPVELAGLLEAFAFGD